MKNGQKLKIARTAIGDTAGFYDTFTVKQVIAWNPAIPQQELRDAIRSMVKTNGLIRIGQGEYQWNTSMGD